MFFLCIWLATLVADCTVFDNNIATVIGPTPPGTGVIADAFAEADSKWTSPTKRRPLIFEESKAKFKSYTISILDTLQ